jgi:hypothetical protein
MIVGSLAANGVKDIPSHIQTDGPVVTPQNGAGLLFMEKQFLL